MAIEELLRSRDGGVLLLVLKNDTGRFGLYMDAGDGPFPCSEATYENPPRVRAVGDVLLIHTPDYLTAMLVDGTFLWIRRLYMEVDSVTLTEGGGALMLSGPDLVCFRGGCAPVSQPLVSLAKIGARVDPMLCDVHRGCAWWVLDHVVSVQNLLDRSRGHRYPEPEAPDGTVWFESQPVMVMVIDDSRAIALVRCGQHRGVIVKLGLDGGRLLVDSETDVCGEILEVQRTCSFAFVRHRTADGTVKAMLIKRTVSTSLPLVYSIDHDVRVRLNSGPEVSLFDCSIVSTTHEEDHAVIVFEREGHLGVFRYADEEQSIMMVSTALMQGGITQMTHAVYLPRLSKKVTPVCARFGAVFVDTVLQQTNDVSGEMRRTLLALQERDKTMRGVIKKQQGMLNDSTEVIKQQQGMLNDSTEKCTKLEDEKAHLEKRLSTQYNDALKDLCKAPEPPRSKERQLAAKAKADRRESDVKKHYEAEAVARIKMAEAAADAQVKTAKNQAVAQVNKAEEKARRAEEKAKRAEEKARRAEEKTKRAEEKTKRAEAEWAEAEALKRTQHEDRLSKAMAKADELKHDLTAARRIIQNWEKMRDMYTYFGQMAQENVRLAAQCEMLEPAARLVTVGFPDGTTVRDAMAWFHQAHTGIRQQRANFAAGVRRALSEVEPVEK
jgi:hypothetical protein